MYSYVPTEFMIFWSSEDFLGLLNFNSLITHSRIMEIFFFNLASSPLTFWLRTLLSHCCLINSQDLWEFFPSSPSMLNTSFLHFQCLSTADANYERMVLRFFYINRITFYDLLVLIPYTCTHRWCKNLSPSLRFLFDKFFTLKWIIIF